MNLVKPKVIKDFKESVTEFKQLDKILPTYACSKGLRVMISTSSYTTSPDKTYAKNLPK